MQPQPRDPAGKVTAAKPHLTHVTDKKKAGGEKQKQKQVLLEDRRRELSTNEKTETETSVVVGKDKARTPVVVDEDFARTTLSMGESTLDCLADCVADRNCVQNSENFLKALGI